MVEKLGGESMVENVLVIEYGRKGMGERVL